MIYLLSDLHAGGEESIKSFKRYLETAREDDLLILLGDICLKLEDTPENRAFDEFFLSVQKNIAFIDGNHENFDYLYSFPEEDWNGGRVHRLTEHIVHMKRGHIFTLQGKTFLTFGGCKSSSRWKDRGLWYPQEEPTEEEYALLHQNLEKSRYKVDYILTHKYENGRGTQTPKLRELAEYIDANVEFKTWYAGHWHTNDAIDEKHLLIFDVPVPVAE